MTVESVAIILYKEPITDNGGMGVFFAARFLKKGHFVYLYPLNRCHFQPFLIKIFFSKFWALHCVR